MMNTSRHHPHHEHHDVHQRLLWFFSFCNQRSSSSSGSSTGSNGGGPTRSRSFTRRKSNNSRNKFALQYQQQLLQQQKKSSNVFGLDLIEHTQLFNSIDSIPPIVKACTKFIEKHGIIFGIYRLSGMRVNINKLRNEFDTNPKISKIDHETISTDAHAVACVLKQYFRELPIPLLTFHMYEKFIELFKQNDNKNHGNTITNKNNKKKTNLAQTNNDLSNIDDENDDDAFDGRKQSSDQQQQHDTNDGQNNNISERFATKLTKKSTSSTPISKNNDRQNISATKTNQKSSAPGFTSSASDSQLLSLSSVVTTTTSDVQYHVNLDDLKLLLLQLPRPHYQTLKYLMRHLAFIAANGERTGMDSKNVAIVWAPNLLKPRELELSAGLEALQIIGLQAVITEQLIKHHKFLFDDDRCVGGRVCGDEEIQCIDDDEEDEIVHLDQQQESNPRLSPDHSTRGGVDQSDIITTQPDARDGGDAFLHDCSCGQDV